MYTWEIVYLDGKKFRIKASAIDVCNNYVCFFFKSTRICTIPYNGIRYIQRLDIAESIQEVVEQEPS